MTTNPVLAARRAAYLEGRHVIRDVSGPTTTLAARYWAKVAKDGPTLVPELGRCWRWTASTTSFGYGQLNPGWRNAAPVRAHRVSWEIHNGPIPAGLDVLHRCDNPPCSNPDHLFLGTALDNMRDMIAKGRARHPRSTHCSHGHPFDGVNGHALPDGRMRCRACGREAMRRYRERRAAGLPTPSVGRAMAAHRTGAWS